MRHTAHHHHPAGAGKSSFDLVDPGLVFDAFNLQPGDTFLDVACGRGAYSLAASERVGKTGTVHAVDLWAEGIDDLKKAAADRKIVNIRASVADAAHTIPVDDRSVDVCLLAAVLHDFEAENSTAGVLNEVVRVLKPGGTLFIMEFKTVDGPPGPPLRIRLSPEDCKALLAPFGFASEDSRDVGPHNYMMRFRRP